MEFVEHRTGLNKTYQWTITIATCTMGVLYTVGKLFRNRIRSEKSVKCGLNVLILGASRGIGLGLARQFLQYGDNVIIASSSSSIEAAYNALLAESDFSSRQTLARTQCDVTNASELEQCVAFALQTFGNHKIDIVINNFGVDSNQRDYLWNISSEDIQRIVSVNLGGILLSIKTCIASFIASKQQTPMHIFNMSGAGTDGGMATPRFVAYGASKAGFLNIQKSVNKELKTAGLNPRVWIHTLSPGMVWTELLAKNENIQQRKPVLSNPKSYWIINALTDDVKVVCAWMVPKIRGVATMRKPCSSKIYFLTTTGVALRLVGALLFGYHKKKYVDENGIAVQPIQ